MLIEVKVKTTRQIENKTIKRIETYLTEKEFYAEAELAVTAELHQDATVSAFEIQSLKLSPIKEIAEQFTGENSYLLTLKDCFLEDDGTEKYLRYKVLLDADSLKEAAERAHELQREGYDMTIEDVREYNCVRL